MLRQNSGVATGLRRRLGDLGLDRGFPVATELATLCCNRVGSSCVATQILCRDRCATLWAGSGLRHDFSCRDRGSRWDVATWILVSRHESYVVELKSVATRFLMSRQGLVFWCRDTIFDVAIRFDRSMSRHIF